MSRPSITLSLNPTYFCNFDCDFCYLTPEQLNDKKQLELDKLTQRVLELKQFYQIDMVDIYGGEISLLSKEYLEEIVTLFSDKTHINLITNLSKIHPLFLSDRFDLSVSWEDDIRRKSEAVFQNIHNVGRDVHLLMLAGPEMLSWKKDKIINLIKKINNEPNISSVEIKPYSSNQSNNFPIKFTDFEEHIKIWINEEKSFLFVNEENLKGVFAGTSNSFSDDHIYITPEGDFAVLEFDKNDNEFFKPLNSVEDYIEWTNNEKAKTSLNSFCSSCEYFGRCLTEHIREVKDIDNSCNGFYKLIEWFKVNKIERV